MKNYKEVFTQISELTKDVQDDCIKDIWRLCQNRLILIDWYENYGIKLESYYKPFENNYFRISDDMIFSYFKNAQEEKDSGIGRYISWSDDGRQPKEEWLFSLSYSTGAYIFGNDYDGQQQLFLDFFNELKSYKPDYSDTTNNNLYWKLENAKDIFNEYNNILQKYHIKNREELKERKIAKLEEELSKLKV